MTVKELINQLNKVGDEAEAWEVSFYGEEIDYVDFDIISERALLSNIRRRREYAAYNYFYQILNEVANGNIIAKPPVDKVIENVRKFTEAYEATLLKGEEAIKPKAMPFGDNVFIDIDGQTKLVRLAKEKRDKETNDKLDFLLFLMNTIQPNEMETYIRMYKSTGENKK